MNCKSVRYCSRECQVKDWPNHKKWCIEQKKINDILNSMMANTELPEQVKIQAQHLILDENKEIELLAYNYINKTIKIIKKCDDIELWNKILPQGVTNERPGDSNNFRLVGMSDTNSTQNGSMLISKVNY